MSGLISLGTVLTVATTPAAGPDSSIARAATVASPSADYARLADAPAWTVVGRDDPRTEWRQFWMLDGERATVTRDAKGFEFRAGPRRGEDADHAVLWTRATYRGDVKVTFDYTRTGRGRSRRHLIL